jgi:hypothetical protein
MVPRLNLNQILEAICDNVYFQPPTNVQMEYPAIVYQRDTAFSSFADNSPYRVVNKYEVTLISRNPDESILNALASLSMCTHQRFFVSDNLNHDVFMLYF